MANILIVDDEEGIRTFVADALRKGPHKIELAADGEEALAHLKKHGVDLVISDLTMPKLDGMQLLQQSKALAPEVEFIMMTAHGSVQSATEAMKAGAFDYLTKPLSGPAELRLLVERALERRVLLDLKAQHSSRDEGPALAYKASSMTRVERALQKVAATQATVLLLGESGSGKELCAKRLHAWSNRSQSAFIAINCAALTDTLLESTLFGHEKGAFTGADKRQRGQLELAQGGTFFLDEVGELKQELQAKLLRVLEERTYQRLGGHQLLEADIRFVAATNRNLAKMVEDGTFREDLYHRLAVFPIEVPPLRERREDIASIAEVLLKDIASDMGRSGLTLGDEVSAALTDMPWPGNIRQLRNTLERAAILCEKNTITKDDLWTDPGFSKSATKGPQSELPNLCLADIERMAIEQTMKRCDSNRARAAEALGISVRSLYDRLKRYEK